MVIGSRPDPRFGGRWAARRSAARKDFDNDHAAAAGWARPANKLRLKVNEAKSAVARPEERKFLGFSIANDGSERCIAPQALAKFRRRSGI
jgi:hypothetical protein